MEVKKSLLFFLIITTALDLGLSYGTFAFLGYKHLEQNPFPLFLMSKFGLLMTCLVILPVYLSISIGFLYYAWDRIGWLYKMLYLPLCAVKLWILCMWINFFVIFLRV